LLAALFGLDVAGIDIISPGITQPGVTAAIINKVNSAPLGQVTVPSAPCR
jgi:hypothetical protein